MKYFRSPLFIVLAIILPIIGAVIGVVLWVVWQSGNHIQWKPLPEPPANITEIVGGTPFEIFVKSTEDKVYSCEVPVWGKQCWNETDEPVTVNDQNILCGEVEKAPYPPVEIIDYYTTQVCYADSNIRTDYALLEDGRIWIWRKSNDAYANFFQCIVSMCLGALIGSSIVRILRPRISQRRAF